MRQNDRRGLTLPELTVTMGVVAIVAMVLSALAVGVHQGVDACQSQGKAADEARVILDRMSRTVASGHAAELHPGAAVVSSAGFPGILVVWNPAGPAANPQGPPLAGEIVVFRRSIDPAVPGRLVEVTFPGDSTAVPLDGSLTKAEVDALCGSASAQVVVLSDNLWHTDEGGGEVGGLFVDVEHSPTEAQLSDYRKGDLTWNDLPWVQGMKTSSMGIRQVHVRIELSLLPPGKSAEADSTGQTVLPFVGSAALTYEVNP
jgi:prepilin-type N-terminal cleavage/methylation domain-containing protein